MMNQRRANSYFVGNHAIAVASNTSQPHAKPLQTENIRLQRQDIRQVQAQVQVQAQTQAQAQAQQRRRPHTHHSYEQSSTLHAINQKSIGCITNHNNEEEGGARGHHTNPRYLLQSSTDHSPSSLQVIKVDGSQMASSVSRPPQPHFRLTGQMHSKAVTDEDDETLEMPTGRDRDDDDECAVLSGNACASASASSCNNASVVVIIDENSRNLPSNKNKNGKNCSSQHPMDEKEAFDVQQPKVDDHQADSTEQQIRSVQLQSRQVKKSILTRSDYLEQKNCNKSPASKQREQKSRNQLQTQTATLVPPPNLSPTNQQRLFDNFKEARKTLIRREKPINMIPQRALTNLEMTPQMDSFSFTRDHQQQESPLRPATVLKVAASHSRDFYPQKQLLLLSGDKKNDPESKGQNNSMEKGSVRNCEQIQKCGKSENFDNQRPGTIIAQINQKRVGFNRTPLLASPSFEVLRQKENFSEQSIQIQQAHFESQIGFNKEYRASSALQNYQFRGQNLLYDPKKSDQQSQKKNHKQCSLIEISMPNADNSQNQSSNGHEFQSNSLQKSENQNNCQQNELILNKCPSVEIEDKQEKQQYHRQRPSSLSHSSGMVHLREVLTRIHSQSPFQSNAFIEVPSSRVQCKEGSEDTTNQRLLEGMDRFQVAKNQFYQQIDPIQENYKQSKVLRGEIRTDVDKNFSNKLVEDVFNNEASTSFDQKGELFNTFQSENVTETVDYELYKNKLGLDSRHKLLSDNGFGEIAQKHHKRRLLLQIDELEYELDHPAEEVQSQTKGEIRNDSHSQRQNQYERECVGKNLVNDSSASVRVPSEFMTQSTMQAKVNQSRIEVESYESPLQVNLTSSFAREKYLHESSQKQISQLDSDKQKDRQSNGSDREKLVDKKVEMQKEVGLVCETQSSYFPAHTEQQMKSERKSNTKYSIGRVSIGLRRETSFETIENLKQTLFLSGKRGLRKQNSANSSDGKDFMSQDSSLVQSQGELLDEQEGLLVDAQLDQIDTKLNGFTLDKFELMRDGIQERGFYQQKQGNRIDKNSYDQAFQGSDKDESGLDLLSELMITEDHRLVSLKQSAIMQQVSNDDLGASKRIHIYENKMNKVSKSITHQFVPADSRNLARQIQIYEDKENGGEKELIHTVTCSGFTCAAPQLKIKMSERNKKFALGILDRNFSQSSSHKDNNKDAGPIFLSLLTDSILYSFFSAQVKQFSCGFEHCVAVTESGSVVSWGYGASGCLGHGNFTSYTQPKLITAGGLNLKQVSAVQAGAYHVAALTDEGHLYMWGRADVGQLGLSEEFLEKDNVGHVLTYPMHLAFFQKEKIKIIGIALGEAHSLVLSDKGHVYSFGWNQFGQLGIREEILVISAQKQKRAIYQVLFQDSQGQKVNIRQISCGSISSYAISDDAKLYAWGSFHQNQNLRQEKQNLSAQKTISDRPTLVDELKELKVISLVCGDSTTFVDTGEGKVFAWGKAILESSKDDKCNKQELIEVPRNDIIQVQSVETLHKFLVQNTAKINRDCHEQSNKESKNKEDNFAHKKQSQQEKLQIEPIQCESQQEQSQQYKNIEISNRKVQKDEDGKILINNLNVEINHQPRESTAEFQSHMRKIRKSIMEVQKVSNKTPSNDSPDQQNSFKGTEDLKTKKVTIPNGVQDLDISLSDLEELLDQPQKQQIKAFENSPRAEMSDSPEGTIKFNQQQNGQQDESCYEAKKSTISRLQQESECFLSSIMSISSPDLASTQQRKRNDQSLGGEEVHDLQANIQTTNLEIVNPALMNLSKFQLQDRKANKSKGNVREFRLSKDLNEQSFQTSQLKNFEANNYNSVDVSIIGENSKTGEIKNQMRKNLRTVKQISLVNSGVVKKDQRQIHKNSDPQNSINSFSLQAQSFKDTASNLNQLSTNSTQIPKQRHFQELRSPAREFKQSNQKKDQQNQKYIKVRKPMDISKKGQIFRIASPQKQPSDYVSASQIEQRFPESEISRQNQDTGPLTLSELNSDISKNTTQPRRNQQKNKKPIVTINLQIRSPKAITTQSKTQDQKIDIS